MTLPHMGKSSKPFTGTTKLSHWKKTGFPSRPQLCSSALNCPSRCTEMETSYSIHLPAHKRIVMLASNVTCIGSECKTDHCACETCPKLWVQRTNDWTQTVAIIATTSENGAPHSCFSDKKTAQLFCFQLGSSISKFPCGATQIQAFLPFPWLVSWFARHTTDA